MSSKGRDGRDLGPGRLSVFAATGGSSMMPDVPLCGTSANGPVDAASGDPLAAALGGAGGPAAVSSPFGSATASSPGSAAPGAVGPGDGTVVPEPHGGPFDPGGGIVPVSLKQLELAVETDYEFFILFGDVDAAATYVVEMYAQVSDIYMRDVDTRVEVVFVRIWDDPDDLFNDPSPLSGFRSYWNENMGSVQRDAAQLFSGRRDYPFGGQAFLSALCTPSAYSVVGYAIGFFPDPAASSPYHYDIFVTAHELGHNAGTSHTHDGGNTIDTCNDPTTQPQRGSIMSYCQQTWSGGNANQDNYFHRLIQPAMDQHIGASACVVNDCNMNSVPDAADINIGNSADDNGNGIPDECEDCNENGVLDDADIAQGTSLDLNFNGVPDECEPDCNNNGVPDDRDITIGTSVDLYGNDIPDECEADCNGNGVSDYTELQANMPLDIGRDVILDACQDCDDDGVTDLNALAGGHGVWVASGLKASLVRLFHATTGVQMRESTGGSGSRVQEGQDVIVTSNGHVFVTSGADDRVLEFDAAGMYQGDFVSPGAGGLTFPTGLVLAPDGKLLVCSRGTDSVLAYSGADGTFLGPFVASGAGGLTQPFGLTFGPNGNLFVTSGTNEVIEYDGQDGSFVGVFVSSADNGGLKDPKGLAFKPDGNLLVASFGTNETLEYDGTSGASLGKWALAGTPDVLTQISPWGIRIGPNGNVYIVRTGEDFGSGDGGEHHDGSDNDSMRWSDLHLTNAQIYEFDVHNGNFVRAYVSGNDHDLQFPTGFAFVPRWEDDCNVNLVPDGCDITSGASEDLDGSGVPDECEVDCNGNGVFDRFDIIPLGTGLDCNFNGVPDECDVADGTSDDCNDDGRPDECGADCNGNGVLDLCDIADGTSEDCNGDGVPNECDPDCNGNGEPDGCDIAGGGSSDCDDNGVPDECEPDCNNNGVADACDIAGGGSSDCDGNGVPDECDPDCNGNGAADACDIADGSSQDENHNGIPDECECSTTQLIKLTASDAAGGDNFGSAVAVSGDAAVVSSPLDGFAAGAAYVYRIDGGSATQEAKLTAPSPVPGDVFGTSVGIRGDVIVAGAPGDFVAGPQSGSAFVYRLIDGWSVETQLTASDAATGDFFGNGVAIGDGLIVVGAPGDNGLRGSAYVFRFDVRVGWVQEAKLTASDPTPEAFFGFVVAVRGDVIVVGAPGDADAGFQSGAAYVYRFNGSDWVQEMKLRAPDATAEDIFGVSVSVAGDMALVGAALAGNGSITSGAAYVYRFDGTAWNVEAKLLAPDAGDFDLFGWSASLGDDLALVGARLNDDGAMDAGAAYMFVFDGSNWIPRAKVTPS
ncbi:MAG: M12 family metallo-peptidase, partial [Phycisphaerae bacterium]